MRTTFLLAATVAIAACGKENPSEPPVLTVVLTAPKQTIAVGEPLQLTAIARDVNGVTIPNAKITYVSSAAAIASVNASGRALGVATGSASITATSSGKTSDPLLVTVTSGNVAAVVTMQANTFTPTQVSIKVQQSVAFDFPADEHNVIFRDRATHPGAPTDIPTTKNQLITRAFNTVGTYPYDCMLHPGMAGTVIVQP
jgi:plastocyanin